jgi:drug/metabolite transporter (DMT)-like permease
MQGSPWLGSSLVLISATAFGLVTTQSRLAYDAGSNPLTVVLVRNVAFAAIFGLFLVVRGRNMRLPRPTLLATFWMAALLLLMSVGYLGAVAYIPVGIAALIYFTFPFYVAILSSLAGREPMTLSKGLALAVAFIGLALTLGPDVESLDWRGVACALAAAVAFGTAIAFGGTVMRQNDAFAINVLTNAWMAVALGIYMVAANGIVLPNTRLGFIGLGGATLCYLVAFTAWFLSLRLVSPIRVAVMFNVEPIVSITAAWLVLDERLAPAQLFGGVLVIAAIVAIATRGAPRIVDAGQRSP